MGTHSISSLCTLLSHSHTRTHSQSPFNAHSSHTDTPSLTVSHKLHFSHFHTDTLSIFFYSTLLSYSHTHSISSLCTLLSHSHTCTHSQSPSSHNDTPSLTVSHKLQSSH